MWPKTIHSFHRNAGSAGRCGVPVLPATQGVTAVVCVRGGARNNTARPRARARGAARGGTSGGGTSGGTHQRDKYARVLKFCI